MEDLREVVGVLCDDGADEAPARPQPTLDGLAALVDECRRAGGAPGMPHRRVDGRPDHDRRGAYRVVRAVLRVAAGEPILSPQVTRLLIAHVSGTGANARQQQARAALGRLSDREREVAAAIARGRSNAEIGAELFMTVATVKAHVSSILTKLDLNNRTQIALLAHDAQPHDDGRPDVPGRPS
jgi:DNA-binding CsgD family transcriptional regulator